MTLTRKLSILVVLAALLVPAAPASARHLTAGKAKQMAQRLDAQYKREANSPVEFSEIFRARRIRDNRIDFSYYVLHENGRECFSTIRVVLGRFTARASFKTFRGGCTGPDPVSSR